MSRKATFSFTPFDVCQYLAVRAEIFIGSSAPANPFRPSVRGALTGLISMAVLAASSHWSFGNDLGEHVITGVFDVVFDVDFVGIYDLSFAWKMLTALANCEAARIRRV